MADPLTERQIVEANWRLCVHCRRHVHQVGWQGGPWATADGDEDCPRSDYGHAAGILIVDPPAGAG